MIFILVWLVSLFPCEPCDDAARKRAGQRTIFSPAYRANFTARLFRVPVATHAAPFRLSPESLITKRAFNRATSLASPARPTEFSTSLKSL